MATQAQTPYLSVIIPCWNEEKNLEGGVLDEVHDYLAQQPYPWEVIIVDDGSTDESPRLIRDFVADKDAVHFITIPHGGKPAAVWAGIQEAQGELVLFTDMDQSTPIEELDKLLPWYDQGYDVVIGSRGTGREGTSPLRKVGSVAFLTLRRLVLLPDIRDTQCGFKSCRRAVALDVFPRLQYFQQKTRPEGWKVSAYDVELLHLCERAGYRIQEVVVRWSNRDRSDTKGNQGELARYVHESIEMAKEIVRVKRNQIRGLYE
jgi:glycosyltransferase involved in cell wall biosynthesis